MTDTTKTEALPQAWACAVSWAARLPLTGVYSLRNADILAIQRRLSAVEAERDRLAAECEALRADALNAREALVLMTKHCRDPFAINVADRAVIAIDAGRAKR